MFKWGAGAAPPIRRWCGPSCASSSGARGGRGRTRRRLPPPPLLLKRSRASKKVQLKQKQVGANERLVQEEREFDANTHRKPVFERLRTSPPPAMCVTWMKNLDLVGDVCGITSVCSEQELRQEVTQTLNDLLPHGSEAAMLSVSKHVKARSIADLLSGGITVQSSPWKWR